MSALKADELNRSTLTGFGDEWVPDLWSAQIWRKARADNVILPLLPQIEMPSNPFEVPIGLTAGGVGGVLFLILIIRGRR